MAKNTTATETVVEPKTPSIVVPEMPEGFQDLGLDRFLYKPEACRAMALRGFLIDVMQFGRDKADKREHWDALVVRTTAPTLAVGKDEKGEEVTIPVAAGEEVMIPITEKLEKLRDFALHPTQMAEFVIIPTEKVTLEVHASGPDKGKPSKTMWRYKVGGMPPVLREGSHAWDQKQIAAPTQPAGAALPG